MMYSDADIKRALIIAKREYSCCDNNWISIEPLDESAIQPASVDLKLGSRFMFFPKGWKQTINIKDRQCEMDMIDISACGEQFFKLDKGCFVLGTTIETISLGSKISGRIEGKSSFGRIGLVVHITAGFIDPGFRGQLTLEFYNASSNIIQLVPGTPICQVSFMECMTSCDRRYGSEGLKSHYQNQTNVTPIRK